MKTTKVKKYCMYMIPDYTLTRKTDKIIKKPINIL
jgi:hypothetical protein